MLKRLPGEQAALLEALIKCEETAKQRMRFFKLGLTSKSFQSRLQKRIHESCTNGQLQEARFLEMLLNYFAHENPYKTLPDKPASELARQICHAFQTSVCPREEDSITAEDADFILQAMRNVAFNGYQSAPPHTLYADMSQSQEILAHSTIHVGEASSGSGAPVQRVASGGSEGLAGSTGALSLDLPITTANGDGEVAGTNRQLGGGQTRGREAGRGALTRSRPSVTRVGVLQPGQRVSIGNRSRDSRFGIIGGGGEAGRGGTAQGDGVSRGSVELARRESPERGLKDKCESASRSSTGQAPPARASLDSAIGSRPVSRQGSKEGSRHGGRHGSQPGSNRDLIGLADSGRARRPSV